MSGLGTSLVVVVLAVARSPLVVAIVPHGAPGSMEQAGVCSPLSAIVQRAVARPIDLSREIRGAAAAAAAHLLGPCHRHARASRPQFRTDSETSSRTVLRP
jgi:hypothetical protein